MAETASQVGLLKRVEASIIDNPHIAIDSLRDIFKQRSILAKKILSGDERHVPMVTIKAQWEYCNELISKTLGL